MMNASLLDPDFGSSILNNQKEMLGLIDTNDVAVSMTVILGTMVSLLVGLTYLQTTSKDAATMSRFLPCADSEPSKYAYELYALYYSPLWIGAFSVIVIFELYEDFSAVHYNSVLLALALPLLLQPIVFPSAGFDSPDQNRPLWERYSFKANVWLAIYSFIGNYWYTHYFYSVLKAEYSMPATRLNNVPIAMFFATHFYFSTYHAISNAFLRKVETTYQKGPARTALFVGVVLVFSYFTAFMETLSISSFPYYSFEDRDMAYTVGSAFYGIYFIVSFPAFYMLDSHVDEPKGNTMGLWDTVVSSCGYGMMILNLLDFVRLALDIPLTVGH